MKPRQLKPYTSRIVLIVEHNARDDEEAKKQRTNVIARLCENSHDGVTVPRVRDGKVHQTWLGRPFGSHSAGRSASRRGPVK